VQLRRPIVMRLLQLRENGEPYLVEFIGSNVPPYAILSHTWGPDIEEVSFQDLRDGTGKGKPGSYKIGSCGRRALQDGLQYFWVDTCCIDKTNNTELSEAINSMFKWYEAAEICYAYLSDVDTLSHLSTELDQSRWFTRGWTLQELLAPKRMMFFNSVWAKIDTRANLSPAISRITGISRKALALDFSEKYSFAQIISWAARRETTREEDLAYCLLGVLGINMPLLYGEGTRAFERLQQEYIKASTDHSVFSWRGPGEERGPFALSPAEYQTCKHFTAGDGYSSEFSMTNRGLRIELPLIRRKDGVLAAVLDCRESDDCRRAIYLKEVRRGVYRRVRCAEELLRISLEEDIPAPETLYIERAISRTLGRDRPKDKAYSFRVHSANALLKGFYVRQHYSPDNRSQWTRPIHDAHFSILDVDATGVYSGLLFANVNSNAEFVLTMGVHNSKVWLGLSHVDTTIEKTFERIVDEYYHFSESHDRRRKWCRCAVPWKFRKQDTLLLISYGISVHVDVETSEVGSEYHVNIRVEDKMMECNEKANSQSMGVWEDLRE
jgi:hypothetical protein